jgi:hypothetical protein
MKRISSFSYLWCWISNKGFFPFVIILNGITIHCFPGNINLFFRTHFIKFLDYNNLFLLHLSCLTILFLFSRQNKSPNKKPSGNRFNFFSLARTKEKREEWICPMGIHHFHFLIAQYYHISMPIKRIGNLKLLKIISLHQKV